MFYVPDQQNDTYSQGFRKMINRVIKKLKKQQDYSVDASIEKKSISASITYQNIHLKKRRDLFQDKKKEMSLVKQHYGPSGFKQIPQRVLLPKLQTPNSRLNIKGEQVSNKFIRSSDKQIANMLQKMRSQQVQFSLKSIDLKKRKRNQRGRKIKSECIEQLDSGKYRKNKIFKQQISPWALNSTSNNFFFQN